MSRLLAESPTADVPRPVAPGPAVPRPVAPGRETQPRLARPGQTLFRVIWRWHFYAGLFVAPIVIVAALTGGIYLFAAEIGDVANREQLFAAESTAGGEPAAAQAIVDAAEAALPEQRATGLTWHADARRTVEVKMEPRPSATDAADSEADAGEGGGGRRGRGTTVYVHPSTAEVQAVSGGPQKLSGFFRVVLEIHRTLFAGTPGRIVVELATCWTIVLFLTGAYLWWPRRKEKVRGVWKARWSAKPYTRLRDLHALTGIYLWPVCMTIFVTGLFYTLVWGKSFHVVSAPLFAATAPTADDPPPGETAEEDAAPRFTFGQAVAEARAFDPARDVTISIPHEPGAHYEVSAINDYARGTYGAMNSTGFKLHRHTGDAFGHEDLADNERYWWHTWAYPLHVGSVFGPASKVLWLIACVALVALPVTGLWMWWKRRPAGRTGFPRDTSAEAVPVWLWGGIALLCVLLPAFGLSAALVALCEWSLSRRRAARGH
ncbi:PepSY-associated TM helix domain-containing protein [Alienimonas californiensis]|uniref:PepSY-associated TM helix n=1 Tax=Alienimonas californiensis TaxID=2527989 RepID=A0A517P414_9PLAN|nr:PepSY-associated TM helix domain-containing protein [Alienimonas californiensis]QDT14083.1 PepSY-associated TM helix [Alienimonas californiensis]